MSGPGIRVRFAALPTGEHHRGSARTALFNHGLALDKIFAPLSPASLRMRVEDLAQA